MKESAPRVAIVGAGFAGLNAALSLAKFPVQIFLIDKKNHHTFQPLLYQVAMAVLSSAEIASPVRGVVERFKNVHVLLGEVTGFDLAARKLSLLGEAVAISYV